MSYDREELLATKLRALLQRNKNRDLFDLNEALLLPGLDHDRLVHFFGATWNLKDIQSPAPSPRSGCCRSSIGA